MAEKYYKDGLIAGAAVRDANGKRINTTYQKRLIAGANITINPETNEISASGGLSDVSWGSINGDLSSQTDLQEEFDAKQDKLQLVTYAELVELKANAQLKEGTFYRITDYVTTTNGATVDDSSEPSRSAGHQFDIIIQALGSSNLSDIGTCALHEGDTYFASQNLGAWQVWYDIENNASKYKWAVTDGTGKGVIYRMIDEHQNDLPYDFKNIQFFRDKTKAKYSLIASGLKSPDNYYYTFHNGTDKDWSFSGLVSSNIIDSASNTKDTIVLLNIVIISDGYVGGNTIGTSSYNNTFLFANTGGNTTRIMRRNTIMNECRENVCFFEQFTGNTVGISFKTNNIKSSAFNYNNIGGFCQNNTIRGFFSGNEIGATYQNNTINGTSYGLDGCIFNPYVRDCVFNEDTWGIIVESETRYVNVPEGTYGTTIKTKTKGSSATNKLNLTGIPTFSDIPITVQLDKNKQVLATWQDNGKIVGKKKTSVTATSWVDLEPQDSVQIDNETITKNSEGKIQAEGLINKNNGETLHYWVGTKAEYQAQNIETEHPDWIATITDDTVSGGEISEEQVTEILAPVNEAIESKASLEDFYEAQVVIDTFVDGTSGYRIWSDGYCEQWGVYTLTQTVKFLKTYLNTNYNLTVTSNSPTNYSGTIPLSQMGWTSKTATGFTAYADANMTKEWRACGYLAEGEY